MSAYVIVQVNVTDSEKYDEYKKLTPASAEKYGGSFIVRGGAMEYIEGELPYARVVVLEFPDTEKASEWYNGPEYQHAKSVREGASEGVFTLVEGS